MIKEKLMKLLLTKILTTSKLYFPSNKPVVKSQAETQTPYSARDPPADCEYKPTELCTETFEPPESVDLKVFRPLKMDEMLGPCASKDQTYKNPEYFAYHRFSYAQLLVEHLKIKGGGGKKKAICGGKKKTEVKC